MRRTLLWTPRYESLHHMDANNFSNAAAERLIQRMRKRIARLSAEDAEEFHLLTTQYAKLAPGARLNAQQVTRLHQLAAKCGA